jgi:hypothetical protein
MTTRTLTPAVDGAMAAGHVPLLVFVLMDFPSGMLRVNNSGVTIPWDGHDWLGVGRLGSIGSIDEGATLEARGLSLAISGVPPENIALALGQSYQGRDCKVWVAPLTDGHAVVADPVLIFHGRMDTMDIDLGETATITVSAESRLADWDRPRVRRYNHEDQQIDYPGDKGFEFVPQMVEKELRWGY